MTIELLAKIDLLEKENQRLNKQLDYLRNGEYLNQLKFEVSMLEHIIENGEVSEEDKRFIDMAYRNTELLEENQELEKQLEVGEEQYNDLVEEKEDLQALYDDANLEIQKYKAVIDKAVEYIEKHLTDNGRFLMLNEWQVPDLLKILKEVE